MMMLLVLKTIDQLVSYLLCQNVLKELCTTRYFPIEEYSSLLLCGYRKGYSTQYDLLGLIEKWKQMLGMVDILVLP